MRRHTTGTGRMRYLKKVHRRFENNFKFKPLNVTKKKPVTATKDAEKK